MFTSSRVDEFWTKEQKCTHLDAVRDKAKVVWNSLRPDEKGNWLTEGLQQDFGSFPALGPEGIFSAISNGLKTNRDTWVYNFDRSALETDVNKTIAFFSSELDRWKRRKDKKTAVDDFVAYDDSQIAWSRDLKVDLERERHIEYTAGNIRQALYRPFARKFVYFDRILNEEVYTLSSLLPDCASEQVNRVIAVTGPASEKPFMAMAARCLLDFHLSGAGCSTQCFPFYTYDEDGSNRRENITDWALNQFRAHYSDPNITKWDIFHYVYAVLHHPQYRERYAANLKRELPRIPFVGGSPSSSLVCHHEGASAPRDLLSSGLQPHYTALKHHCPSLA